MRYYVKRESIHHKFMTENKFIFSEYFLLNARIIEVDSLYGIRNFIIHDWVNGNFGSKPDLYKWINRPYNDGKVNKNCKVL